MENHAEMASSFRKGNLKNGKTYCISLIYPEQSRVYMKDVQSFMKTKNALPLTLHDVVNLISIIEAGDANFYEELKKYTTYSIPYFSSIGDNGILSYGFFTRFSTINPMSNYSKTPFFIVTEV